MVLLATNALAYVLTMLAARLLAPAAFGELSALLAVLLITTVPAAALQTTAALQVEPGADGSAARRMHATALAVAVVLAAVVLAAAAPLSALLHLTDGGAVDGLAVLLAAQTLVGVYDGILLGTGRTGRLAAAAAGFGTLKILGGTAGLLMGATPAAAVVGMAAGAGAGAALSWLLCGRTGVGHGVRQALAPVGRTAVGLLGFVVLTSLDVLLARYHLSPDEAGRYALGAVVTKVAFWFPEGVGVVLLPRLRGAHGRAVLLPRALALVAGSGLLVAAGLVVLGPLLVPPESTVGGVSWLFAALGTLLAMGRLLLLSGVAAADGGAIGAVWAAAGLEVLAITALAHAGLLTVNTLCIATTTVILLLVAYGVTIATRRDRRFG